MARVYRALAESVIGESQQEVLWMLARRSEQSALKYAARLARLSRGTIQNEESLRERLWRWLLVHCGLRCAMTWIEWIEKRNIRLYVHLFEAYKLTQASTESYPTESFRQFLLKYYDSDFNSEE